MWKISNFKNMIKNFIEAFNVLKIFFDLLRPGKEKNRVPNSKFLFKYFELQIILITVIIPFEGIFISLPI
jgi:hypothetical protein